MEIIFDKDVMPILFDASVLEITSYCKEQNVPIINGEFIYIDDIKGSLKIRTLLRILCFEVKSWNTIFNEEYFDKYPKTKEINDDFFKIVKNAITMVIFEEDLSIFGYDFEEKNEERLVILWKALIACKEYKCMMETFGKSLAC